MSKHWRDVFHHSHGMRDYDEILVPRMFTPWAEIIVDALEVEHGDAALDVACGPGSASRVSAHVGPTGRVTGCDLSPAMLEIAREHGIPAGGGPIDYVECPADALAVESGTYRVIVCQQGLQFFPDRPAALREMRRAGHMGTRIGIACWAPIDTSPMFAAMARALEATFGDDVAGLYRAGPWGLTDRDALVSLLEDAGFLAVDVEALSMPVTFDDAVAQLMAMAEFMPVGAQLDAMTEDEAARFVARLESELGPLLKGDAVTADTVTHLALATI